MQIGESPVEPVIFMDQLIEHYSLRKKEIQQRLAEFSKLRNASEERLFYELCFCITTANGSAKAGMRAQECLERNRVWTTEKLGGCLDGVRFGRIKAGYIRNDLKNIKRDGLDLREFLMGDAFGVRELLVKDKRHFKGLGYKEASHFLRNIGRGGNLAILDRHILSGLCELKVLCNVPDSIGRKKYLGIEQKMQEFSQKAGIPMGKLDLLFWSLKTGIVLK